MKKYETIYPISLNELLRQMPLAPQEKWIQDMLDKKYEEICKRDSRSQTHARTKKKQS